MLTEASGEAVLVCGAYGTGKSSVAAEIAETLERNHLAYGALDLDWLMWFDVPGLDRAPARRVSLANIAAVVGNYRDAGVRYLVLAGAVRDRLEVKALQAAVGVPIRVVQLHVPYDEIARRLQRDPTSGRRHDLQVAKKWLEDGIGDGVGDVDVRNTGRVDLTAAEIVTWLGWAT
jgi:chloramphenicol 3-O-phosphotransferase